MWIRFGHGGRVLLAISLVGSAVLLSSSDKPALTVHDKAYYADPSLVNFVRPGLVVKITSASIADDGTIQAAFTLSDPKGLPLDRQGVTTPGTISTSFVASFIPADQPWFTAYTTTTQTSPITNVSAVQPAADTGGSYQQVGDGQYIYTFGTKAPANFDRTATTGIGVFSSRNLSEFDLGTNFDDDVLLFVPNGSPVTKTHEVIDTSTCNKCHDPLAAHGGARRSMQLCVLCHTQPAIDPDTGNSIQFRVMIHKIHDAAELPSVKAGKPYHIIGFQQAVNDFSTIEFPADLPGEGARNCQFCHESGPPDSNWWLTRPNMAACGSCHDNVNFMTGENHANGLPASDNQCMNCHIPQGELPFDASIMGAHTIPRFAPGLAGVVFTLENVADGVAGKAPTVTFTLKDKAGNPIQPSDMNLLNLVMAGPASDYASVVTNDARKAAGSGGTYMWTFQNPIPADAKGTFTIGIEGYRNATLLPGTVKAMTVRDVGQNKIINFSVDGSEVQPHAVEVTEANCNSCHFMLAAHGTIRNEVQYCLLCHNPNATDVSQRPADQLPPQTIDFPVLIHRIHTGEDQESPFVVFGFGMQPVSFDEVRFPGDRRDCQKCHVNNSQQVPAPGTRLPVQTPRGFITPTQGPTQAACLGCHTSQSAAAHAMLNASATLGEACAVCHGPSAEFSVDRVHARTQ